MDAQTLFSKITDAAHNHGCESGVEYEAGDLLEALRAAFRLMTPEQIKQLDIDLADDLADWL